MSHFFLKKKDWGDTEGRVLPCISYKSLSVKQCIAKVSKISQKWWFG